ncbi:MAG: MlaD family protein [Desulfobacterales bacterium]
MQSLRTKFSVGLFVIIGMSIVIVFVLYLGMSEYFREGRKYNAYFDESVQGLSRDAAVKYRGVNVGQVDSIGVAPDGRLVEIVFTLSQQLRNPENLVAQIKSVGITGIMFVELERRAPGVKAKTRDYEFDPDYPVIPTRPSEMKRLMTDINQILSQIKQVDMEGISNRLITMIESMNRTLVTAEIEKISHGLQKTIDNTNKILDSEKWEDFTRSADNSAANLEKLINETRAAVKKLDESVSGNSQKFNQASEQVTSAAQKAEKLFGEGSHTLDSARARGSDYDREMGEIIKELKAATSGLNRLIDQVNRQPSRLLYGPPVPEKTIEPEE